MSIDYFAIALKQTLLFEGGYVNNPNDPGGSTNKGVTKAVYDSYRLKKGLAIQSVKLISNDEVYDIYKNLYWNACKCDLIKDPKLAISVFDFGVNAGTSRALRYLALTLDWKVYNANRKAYYNKIVNNNVKLNIFLRGWLKRVDSLVTYLTNLEIPSTSSIESK